MPICACGCGEETKKGKFLAGHEQKLRKQLEEAVGGIQLLASLVKAAQMYANDRMSLADLGQMVKLIFRQEK